MPWAFWKRQAWSVRAAEKSSESLGSDAARRAQKESPGSATTERHWRPVEVRCWHRSGVKSELAGFCVISVLVDWIQGMERPPHPGCFAQRVRKALKTND